MLSVVPRTPINGLRRRHFLTAGACAIGGLSATSVQSAPHTRHGFNDDGVNWMLLEDGLAAAKTQRRPSYVLTHATWCHNCREFRQSFYDTEVIRLLREFVPILIDADAQPEANFYYAVDGHYVPRSMVLDSSGALLGSVVGPYAEFRHFIPTSDPIALAEYLDHGLRAFRASEG